jgi:hypothetical protein
LERTRDALNDGPYFGDGIYQSNASEVSFSYPDGGRLSLMNANKYKNTRLPNNMTVLSLCVAARHREFNYQMPRGGKTKVCMGPIG